MEFIDKARESEPLSAICKYLQLNSRAYYRWKQVPAKENHGGGGGKNKITPLEEKRVLRVVKKNPGWHCRRIAYHLEKKAQVFIGKTKVAEIMKSHGLNHPFIRESLRHIKEGFLKPNVYAPKGTTLKLPDNESLCCTPRPDRG